MHIPDIDGKILSQKMLDQKGFEIHISGGHVHIMKVGEIYTEASLGGELYEVRMKIIPPRDNEPKRRLKKLEELRAGHTRRPKQHTTQKVSEETHITNIACDAPIDNNTRTCSHEEELVERYTKKHPSCNSMNIQLPQLSQLSQPPHWVRTISSK